MLDVNLEEEQDLKLHKELDVKLREEEDVKLQVVVYIKIHAIFFLIKPTRCTNFTNLFCHETLHISDSSSVHRQEFIHCTLSNGICRTAVEQDQDGTAVPSWSCSKAVYKPV